MAFPPHVLERPCGFAHLRETSFRIASTSSADRLKAPLHREPGPHLDDEPLVVEIVVEVGEEVRLDAQLNESNCMLVPIEIGAGRSRVQPARRRRRADGVSGRNLEVGRRKAELRPRWSPWTTIPSTSQAEERVDRRRLQLLPVISSRIRVEETLSSTGTRPDRRSRAARGASGRPLRPKRERFRRRRPRALPRAALRKARSARAAPACRRTGARGRRQLPRRRTSSSRRSSASEELDVVPEHGSRMRSKVRSAAPAARAASIART